MRTDLEGIFGKDHVSEDIQVLEQYSRDQSFTKPVMPQWVVFPQEVEQVTEVVRLANEMSTPVIPYSSGLNFQGASVPDQGGIILNMSKMNKIIEINERDRWAIIEPGVTYGQLQDELEKHGCRFMLPFGIPHQRSVISSQMERDPSLAAASFNYGNELIMDIEMVLPQGALFKTVGWIDGGKPRSTLNLQHRFWTGSQGTLGAVTKGALKIEAFPEAMKTFFLPFNDIKGALKTIKKTLWREIGMECFLLNNFNMASIMVEDWKVPSDFPCSRRSSAQFAKLLQELPQWTGVICITASSPHFPEEKIAYEEEALREVCAADGIEPLLTLNSSAEEDIFTTEILRPWGVLKKFNYKGSVHKIAFKSPLERIDEFMEIIRNTAGRHDYPSEDIAGYVLPIERASYFHCEFDFFCDPSNEEEKAKTKALWLETSENLIGAGAFFDRPYGPWAEMVFSRAGTYAEKLKEVKKAFDPNNIMNPGKLCFC